MLKNQGSRLFIRPEPKQESCRHEIYCSKRCPDCRYISVQHVCPDSYQYDVANWAIENIRRKDVRKS